MSQRHYPPAYLRYLRARLWTLARPSFWGTAIFLSVVGLVIKEYWTHPDFLTHQNQQAATSPSDDSSLSKEERARVADIDNLPVLYNESEQNDPSATTITSVDQKTNKSLLDELNQKSESSTLGLKSNSAKDTVSAIASPTTDNPFLLQAENLLQISNYTNGNNSLGVNPKVASSIQPEVTQNSLNQSNFNPTINPLQTSLNQSTQNSSNPSNSTSNSINRISQSSPSNVLPSQTAQSTTGLNLNLVNSISTGTGYTQPTITNLVPDSYTNINGNSYTQPTVTNVQPNYSGFGYTQQSTLTNVPPNSNNNYNTSQTLPNVAQPTQIVSPAVTYAAPINTAPYTQTPSQGVVNSTTPVAPNNYNNTVVQPLNSLPQYNPLSPSRQVLRQSTVYGQSNIYSYP